MITFSQLGKYGRLGNQLWQIASTIGISHRNHQGHYFPAWDYQEYFINPLPRIDRDTSNFVKILYDMPGYREYDLNQGKDYDLHGYFQSEKYFEHCKESVKHYLTPKPRFTSIPGLYDPEEDVAIHVRRGDHVWNSFDVQLPMEYYQQAMEKFPQGTQFTVFSDDPAWCQRNFQGNRFSIRSMGHPVMDLFSMSRHKGFIIANSSYSWWGAYLHELFFGEIQVIAPKAWYLTLDSSDLIPDRWERI
jgi:hypothetical protein